MKQEDLIRKVVQEHIGRIFEDDIEGELGDNIEFFDDYEKDQKEYLKSMADKAKAELRTASSQRVAGNDFKDVNAKNIAIKRADQSAWENSERKFDKFSKSLDQSKEFIQQLQQANSEMQQTQDAAESTAVEPPEAPSVPV